MAWKKNFSQKVENFLPKNAFEHSAIGHSLRTMLFAIISNLTQDREENANLPAKATTMEDAITHEKMNESNNLKVLTIYPDAISN